MKFYARSISIFIVALFLGSIALSVVVEKSSTAQSSLESEPVVSEAQSPGHPVFAEYVGAHWCGPCHSMSANLHSVYGTNGGGGSQSEDFTYVSFWESPTTGWGADAPINRRAHLSASAYPTVVYGDAPTSDSTYHTNSRDVTGAYQSGGNMFNANDYSLTVSQSPNGNNMDIEITAMYTGSGSKTVYIYAAVTEKTSPEAYSGSPNPNPHHVWQDWLLNSAGTGFESVTLTSGTPVSKSWSKPISTVRGDGAGQSATDNFLTVAALLDGSHTANRNVLSAADSEMGPKLEIAVTDVNVVNPASSSGYMVGDQLTISATAKNIGGLDYTDGGNLEIIYMDGNSPVVVSTKSLTNLAILGTMTHTANIDTANMPSNAWKTGFGARLTGLIGDRSSNNNILVEELNHDRPPTAKQATVSGENVIERGSIFTVIAKGTADDYVDTIQSMNFELEVSPAGQNLWDGSIDSGGERIVNEGTSNEGREYTMTPTLTMPAGDYDLRSKTIDSRGQESQWRVTPDAFSLANGIPQIVAEPIPTVTCDVSTDVDMTNHISDPETPLSDLDISSDSPYFVSWNPLSSTITVDFAFNDVQGCPLGQKSILVTVDDGGSYSSNNMPYGTLKFNVIENGQPRWLGLPTQSIDEQGPDSDGTLRLLQYVTDTTADGQVSPASLLVFDVVSQTNPGLIETRIENGVLGFETIGTDAEGQSTLTIRACDADNECSDQTLLININPINDAPVIDMTQFEDMRLKTNTESSIDLKSLVSDVDNSIDDVTILVSSPGEPGGAQYLRQTGFMKLKFNDVGDQEVVIKVVDTYDSTEYTFTIEVYDSLEFTIAKNPLEDGFMVVEAGNMYIGQIPTANMYLSEDAPVFTSMTVKWQTCTYEGVCDGMWIYDLDMTQSAQGWQIDVDIPNVVNPDSPARPYGYDYGDYFYIMIDGVDDMNNNYKTIRAAEPLYKWVVTQDVPPPSQMSDDMLNSHIDKLNQKIDQIKNDIETTTGDDTTSLKVELVNAEAELELACLDARVNCVEEQTSGTSADETNSNDNTMLILGIVAAIIIVALLGGMFLMRDNRRHDESQGFKWANSTLPARDAVANSMYGGTQAIFQTQLTAPQYSQPQQAYYQQPQPIQHTPQPTARPAGPPIQAHRGPPFPPGGLPSGWSMDQWEYYGQQYLDRMQN